MPTDRPARGLAAAPPVVSGDELGERAFDHGAVSAFNAWFFDALDRYINHVAGPHKREAFAGVDTPVVLEIGTGTGANLSHLAPGTRLYAVEPSLRMHERLRRRAERAGVELELLPTGAEQIPLSDGSVDEVICSLVLCTVEDPSAVLAEVRRVLRPGGRFRFVEHVAAPGWARPRCRAAGHPASLGLGLRGLRSSPPHRRRPGRGGLRGAEPRAWQVPPLGLLAGEHRRLGCRRALRPRRCSSTPPRAATVA